MDKTETSAVPSVKQMRARLQRQHIEALRNVEAGRPMGCSWTIGDTLMRWGAITGGRENRLTEAGKLLLTVISEQSK